MSLKKPCQSVPNKLRTIKNYGGQNYDKREQSKTGQVSVEPRLCSVSSNRNRSWRKLRCGINFYHRDKEIISVVQNHFKPCLFKKKPCLSVPKIKICDNQNIFDI